jgi:hypothetical protein
MPEPAWTVQGAGSPEVNGDYTKAAVHNDRDAFRNPTGFWLIFDASTARYLLREQMASGSIFYLATNQYGRYDLPAEPWLTSGGQDPPPTLAPYVPPEPPIPPQAINLSTEGQLDPARVRDTTPTLSWTYIPGDDGAQAAYHLRVFSTRAHQVAGGPTLWDTGIVESPQQHVIYAGEDLADYAMYFWSVRVRDESDLWSEDW